MGASRFLADRDLARGCQKGRQRHIHEFTRISSKPSLSGLVMVPKPGQGELGIYMPKLSGGAIKPMDLEKADEAPSVVRCSNG